MDYFFVHLNKQKYMKINTHDDTFEVQLSLFFNNLADGHVENDLMDDRKTSTEATVKSSTQVTPSIPSTSESLNDTEGQNMKFHAGAVVISRTHEILTVPAVKASSSVNDQGTASHTKPQHTSCANGDSSCAPANDKDTINT